MSGLPARVVVASNRAAAGVYDDTTGPLIVEALRELGFEVPDPVVVPDGEPVGEAIARMAAPSAGATITAGMVGFGVLPSLPIEMKPVALFTTMTPVAPAACAARTFKIGRAHV